MVANESDCRSDQKECKMSKFEIKITANGKYYFVLKAKNGVALMYSQAYESKIACLKAIEAVRKSVSNASVVEA